MATESFIICSSYSLIKSVVERRIRKYMRTAQNKKDLMFPLSVMALKLDPMEIFLQVSFSVAQVQIISCSPFLKELH